MKYGTPTEDITLDIRFRKTAAVSVIAFLVGPILVKYLSELNEIEQNTVYGED